MWSLLLKSKRLTSSHRSNTWSSEGRGAHLGRRAPLAAPRSLPPGWAESRSEDSVAASALASAEVCPCVLTEEGFSSQGKPPVRGWSRLPWAWARPITSLFMGSQKPDLIHQKPDLIPSPPAVSADTHGRDSVTCPSRTRKQLTPGSRAAPPPPPCVSRRLPGGRECSRMNAAGTAGKVIETLYQPQNGHTLFFETEKWLKKRSPPSGNNFMSLPLTFPQRWKNAHWWKSLWRL